MAITEHQVQKIAELAKLSFDKESTLKLSEQLESILSLIEKMNAVNTDPISPAFHSLETLLSLRSDKVTQANQREAFQKIAPLCEAGLYLVPKVIE